MFTGNGCIGLVGLREGECFRSVVLKYRYFIANADSIISLADGIGNDRIAVLCMEGAALSGVCADL